MLHRGFALPLAASKALGGPTLEGLLLARHRIIDSILEDLVHGGISQVVEVACGMSPRGWRFTEQFGERLTYVEADLPDMARRKREALTRMESLTDRHRVVSVDVLQVGGQGSLEALVETLDPAEGLVVISEGLLTYLDETPLTRCGQGSPRRSGVSTGASTSRTCALRGRAGGSRSGLSM